MDRDRLRRVAGRQFGPFTRAQAAACGYTAFQIRRRLADGEWQRILGSTLAAAGLRVTATVRDRAAQLAVPGSILAGPSAARAWRIPVPDRGQYLYVGRHGCSRIRGVRLLYEDVGSRDIAMDQGLPIARMALTVVDCLRLLERADAQALLDRALQQGWITIDEFVARTSARVGHPGAPRLVSLMRLVRSGERASSERLLTRLLRGARITGWSANLEIRDRRGRVIAVADVAFERERLVIEVDGWAFHSSPDRFQRDRVRQNRLVADGWRVLRFTWRDLTEHPDRVLAAIAAMIATSRTNA